MRNILFVAAAVGLTACNPVDRSGEQPFAPTVQTVSAEVAGDSVCLTGQVLTSPNSTVTRSGFYYGKGSTSETVTVDSVTTIFSTWVDSLDAGTYYAVAWATNGVGTGHGDTIYFEITEE